jgi:hypothetical protein
MVCAVDCVIQGEHVFLVFLAAEQLAEQPVFV